MLSKVSIISFLIVVIFLAIASLYSRSKTCDIYGVYTADENFLKEADLSSIVIYIGDNEKDKYKSYIYVEREGKPIIDGAFQLKMKPRDGWFNISNGPSIWCDTEDNSNDVESTKTSNLKAHYVASRGILTFVNDGTVYAEVYKNNILTDHARNSQSIS